MDNRLESIFGLLAKLHATVPCASDEREALTQEIIWSLGRLLNADLSVLLKPGIAPPLMGEHQDDNVQLFEVTAHGRHDLALIDLSKTARTTSDEPVSLPQTTIWNPDEITAWIENFGLLAADGLIYRGDIVGRTLTFHNQEQQKLSPGAKNFLHLQKQRLCETGTNLTGDSYPFLATGMLVERHLMRLLFVRENGSPAFSSEDVQVLAGLINHILLRTRLVLHLEKVVAETVTDELTQVYNYRYLKRSLRASLRRIRSDPRNILSVLMIDVDNLRAYNDEFGHLEASAVLAQVGNVLREASSPNGWVAKYGGDEFLACLHDVDKQSAVEEAHNLRRAIEQANIGKPGSGGITCSFGVATAPEDGLMFVDLLESADKSLFMAKELGRNCVAAAGDGSRAADPDSEFPEETSESDDPKAA